MMMRRSRDNDGMVDGALASGGGGVATLDAPEDTDEEGRRASTSVGMLRSLAQIQVAKKRVPRKDLMHFSRQLAVFIKAGIPIIDALTTIQEEVSHKFLKELLNESIDNLRNGSTFVGSFRAYPDAFPDYYLGILESAEMSGSLDTALLQLADYVERDLEARRKIISALTYPAIIALMAIAVVCVLVIYVLPRFEKFFSELDAKLPLPTRMLLSTSRFITHHWYIFAAIGALILVLALWVSTTDRGRDVRDRTLLKTPVLGDLIQHAVIERFCRILASMVSAGVPLPDALAVTSGAAGNTVYKRALGAAREATMRGEGLAAPLNATGLFPGAARQMLRVGEETGTLDQQLAMTAEFFERELDYRIKRFTTLFEPAVIVFMGLIVGFVAVALVSAMYGIFHQVKI